MGSGFIKAEKPALTGDQIAHWRRALPAALVVTLAFCVPLWQLFLFALHDELYSYILLIPFISGYLIWQEKEKTPAASPGSFRLAVVLFLAGAGLIFRHWQAPPRALEDGLCQSTLAYLLVLAGVALWRLGGRNLRTFAFAWGMLIFMVPMPVMMRDWVEAGLQQGSAVAASLLFNAAMMPMVQTGLSFALPGISLQVAPECSGIHSTLVLFITSLLAGHYFLDRPWKRWVICLAVIPLALLRNGFRIFVIGELCVHIGPEMINSVIHRHGGPLFFLLSLIPFFYLIKYLRRLGRHDKPLQQDTKNVTCKSIGG